PEEAGGARLRPRTARQGRAARGRDRRLGAPEVAMAGPSERAGETGLGGGTSRGWLDGQVAVVTGAGTGIGAAVAHRFVAEGARVVLVGRRERPLRHVAAALGERALV